MLPPKTVTFGHKAIGVEETGDGVRLLFQVNKVAFVLCNPLLVTKDSSKAIGRTVPAWRRGSWWVRMATSPVCEGRSGLMTHPRSS